VEYSGLHLSGFSLVAQRTADSDESMENGVMMARSTKDLAKAIQTVVNSAIYRRELA
jgi:hypothetical protein